MNKATSFLLAPVFSSIIFLNVNCTKDNEIDPSKTQGSDSIVVKMAASDWDYYGIATEKYHIPTAGTFEIDVEGVKGFGQTARHGAFLVTREGFDINKKTVYMKWKGNNGNAFCGFIISLTNSGYIYSTQFGLTNYTDLNLCSAPNSFAGSTVVANNTWYYTSISVSNNQFTTKTASGNYAENGGVVLENRTGPLNNTKGSISLRTGDPYAGSNAYVMVGELKIK